MKDVTGLTTPTPQEPPGLPKPVELIDRSGLARRLGFDVRTISRMVKRGELPGPCIGYGGRPRWLWSYIIGFLQRRHERQAKLDERAKEKLS